jgi:hypothetical protein
MGLIGHNGGPSVEPGASWRRHCWEAARAALLPVLPIEVVRTRVKRAKNLGLDYKTYASVRAATGHDLVAFLFSSNALRLIRDCEVLPADRALKLADLHCSRIALVTAPLTPERILQNPQIDAAYPAPFALARFGEVAQSLRTALGRIPGDRVLLIGDQALERDWCAAGRLAGYLEADRYFPPTMEIAQPL